MRQIYLSDLFSIWGYSQVSMLINLRLTERGLSASSIGLLGTTAMVIGALTALPAGLFTDLAGPSTALVTAAVLLASGVWGQVLGSNQTWLFAAYSVTGVGMSLYMAAKIPAIKQNTPAGVFNQTIAFVRGYSSVVALGGGAAASYLCHLTGSMEIPLVVGAVLVSLAVLPLLRLSRRAEKACLWVTSLRKRGRPLPSLWLSFALVTAALALLYPTTHLLLQEQGFAPAQVSLCLTVLQLGPMAAWPLVKSIKSPVGVILPLVLCSLVASSVGLQLGNGWPWLLFLFVWQVLASVVGSLYLTIFSLSGTPGLTFGWLGMVQTASAGLGSWLGGFSMDRLGSPFLVAMPLLLLALITARPASTTRSARI